jgi:hypothetical protein
MWPSNRRVLGVFLQNKQEHSCRIVWELLHNSQTILSQACHDFRGFPLSHSHQRGRTWTMGSHLRHVCINYREMSLDFSARFSLYNSSFPPFHPSPTPLIHCTPTNSNPFFATNSSALKLLRSTNSSPPTSAFSTLSPPALSANRRKR